MEELKYESMVKRLRAELNFARAFADFKGIKEWHCCIEDAEAVYNDAIEQRDYFSLQQAMESIETNMADIGISAKAYTCHCVGHGHLDMNWLWSWPETVASANDMFITVDKLMDEFPDFTFSQSQAAIYEIIRTHNPHLFERIKRRVKEGRWEITASEWVEGDKNLASGESLAHHILYTREYMREHFGLSPQDVTIAWNPDTFGHADTIPMIMNAGGIRHYYTCRGGENDLPPIFFWQSPDGSRLLVNFEHTWYNDSIGTHNVEGLLSFCSRTGLEDWMLVYGVGDHGGGPTRRDLRMVNEMRKWPIYPNFKFSTAREYFHILDQHENMFPTICGELNFEFTGCYSSQSEIKKSNRLGELAATRAETAGVLGELVADDIYPAKTITQAWRNTLFGQFHDILPGSGIAATREYQSGMFQQSAALTGLVQTNALRAVASKVDTTFAGTGKSGKTAFDESWNFGAGPGIGAGYGDISTACHGDGESHAFVIFNPTAYARDEIVILTLWDTEAGGIDRKEFTAYYPDGTQLPAQRIESLDCRWGHQFVKVAVPIHVKSLGYASIVLKATGDVSLPAHNSHCYPHAARKISAAVPTVKNAAVNRELAGYYKGDYCMENEKISVRFDKTTGEILELIDKTTGEKVISPEQPANLLRYVVERPGPMSAWLIRPMISETVPSLKSFEPIHFGPFRAAYQAKYEINSSSIEVTYILDSCSNMMDISIKLDWHEQGTSAKGVPGLRLCIPAKGTDALYQNPFGTIRRKAQKNQEVPSQRFVHAGNILLLNDCKYGYEFDGEFLHCTLIRSTFAPDALPECGRHEMRFGIMPTPSKPSNAACINISDAFNNTLQTVSTSIHSGMLIPQSEPLITVDCPDIIVTDIKKSEDGETIIFRFQETGGCDVSANVALNISWFKIKAVSDADLMEQPVKSASSMTATGFVIKMKSYSILTVKAKIEKL